MFLCHETRDKPEAERISSDLALRGIRPWLDKQSLRGGDNWAKLIPHVLQKQTDYVVVLQSPRMLDKPESYFWREINVSLERQSGFGTDLRFIIPVVIETDARLPLRELFQRKNTGGEGARHTHHRVIFRLRETGILPDARREGVL